jgi:hypothetical protein
MQPKSYTQTGTGFAGRGAPRGLDRPDKAKPNEEFKPKVAHCRAQYRSTVHRVHHEEEFWRS